MANPNSMPSWRSSAAWPSLTGRFALMSLLGFLLCALSCPQSSNTGVTIKAKVRQVLVDVVVTDEHYRPIQGLTREDFTVLENGTPQQILSFEAHTGTSDGNLKTPAIPRMPQNTFLNVSLTSEQLPLNVLLFDALNTPLDNQPYAYQEVIKFLRNLPQGSRFAIFVLGEKLHLLQGFSDNEQQLIAAMSSDQARTDAATLIGAPGNFVVPTAMETGPFAHDPVIRRLVNNTRLVDADARDFLAEHRTELTIAAFAEIARLLNGLPGRKNLIWLSGSFPLGFFSSNNAMNPFGSTVNLEPRLHQAAKMLEVGQVAVYPVDARGLGTDGTFGAQGAGQRIASSAPEAVLAEHLVMEQIADDTGGRAFFNTNGLAEAINSSVEQGANYYTLSYSPTNTNFDGRIRKIRVKVPPNGYQLAYRHSYVADDDTVISQKAAMAPANRLRTALMRGAPLSHDYALELHIQPDGAPERVTKEQIAHLSHFPAFVSEKTWNDVKMQKYQVEYGFLGGKYSFQEAPDESRYGKFEFQFAAYDSDNRPMLGQWTRFDKEYSRREIEEIEKGTFHLKQIIEIPSNAVWLRLVVHDLVGDHIGSIEIPLPVAIQTQAQAEPIATTPNPN